MGIVERRQREKKKRREAIINAAEKIIFRDGFNRASMEQVANEAELSKATIYLYFKSKEELYFAIFLRGQELMFKMIDDIMQNLQSVQDKIKGFLQSMVHFQKKYPDYFEAFFYFTTNQVEVNKENEDFIQNHQQDQIYLNKWIELIKQGKEEKLIRKDLNATSTVLLLWLQLIGMLKIYAVISPEVEQMFSIKREHLLDEYFDLVLKGIYAKR